VFLQRCTSSDKYITIIKLPIYHQESSHKSLKIIKKNYKKKNHLRRLLFKRPTLEEHTRIYIRNCIVLFSKTNGKTPLLKTLER